MLVFITEVWCLLTWKSDSINQPFHSILYKAGAMTTFKMPHVTRLTSLEKDGSSMCVGPKDGAQYDRILQKIDNDTNFKPKAVGSILVPTEDCFIQGTLMKQHFAFKCSVDGYQKITLTKPMYMLEFTPNPVDVLRVCREWLQQFEDGLISIIVMPQLNEPSSIQDLEINSLHYTIAIKGI